MQAAVEKHLCWAAFSASMFMLLAGTSLAADLWSENFSSGIYPNQPANWRDDTDYTNLNADIGYDYVDGYAGVTVVATTQGAVVRGRSTFNVDVYTTVEFSVADVGPGVTFNIGVWVLSGVPQLYLDTMYTYNAPGVFTADISDLIGAGGSQITGAAIQVNGSGGWINLDGARIFGPDTPTLTPTETYTATVTETPGDSPTFTATPTMTPTLSGTCTPSSTATPSATHSATPTPTATITATPSRTCTATQSATGTQSPTAKPSQTSTPTRVLQTLPRDMMAYPNPARDEVRFAWNEPSVDRVEIIMYNIVGEKVADLDAVNPGQILCLNVKNFTPGIYFYKITLTTGSITKSSGYQKLGIVK